MESEGFIAKWWLRVKRYAWISWLLIKFVFVKAADSASEHIVVIRKEAELFSGTALVLIGLLGFNAGRMCDGNTADYLSCTRPSAYHYYSGFDIALVVFGTFFLLLWFLRRSSKK